MRYDVLIAGGGIGGGVLASLLARSGKRVAVIERSVAPPKWLRPEILWPATAQILFSLAPRETWERSAMLPLQAMRIHDGDGFLTLASHELFAASGVQPLFTNPNETREQLLQLDGFELRRGVEVAEVLKEGGRIAGVRTRDLSTKREEEWIAEWTVGDDGVHSLVRQAAGISMDTRIFPIEFFCFALDTWPARLPSATVHLWPNWHHGDSGILLLGCGSLPGGRGVGLVGISGRAFDANPHPAESWKQFCGTDEALRTVVAGLEFPGSFFRVKRPWGHAEHYGAPGALLMGDAAHSVSPVGGQGANMSIADAVVLAELLLNKTPNLLAEYERRRRPANERSMTPTRVAEKVIEAPAWLVPTVAARGMVRWLSRHPSTFGRLLKNVSTLFQEVTT